MGWWESIWRSGLLATRCQQPSAGVKYPRFAASTAQEIPEDKAGHKTLAGRVNASWHGL